MLHSVFWMLFIMTVSSAEVYNEIPRDELYPEIDLAEPAVDDQPSEVEYWRRNQPLYKLLKSLQRDPDTRHESEPIDEHQSDLPAVKEPGIKRWFSIFNSSAAKSRPQRKWKIKKGKGPFLCYFKLCSFRTYN